MLVLDPSSCCDICLDPYDSNDSNPEGSPHLIISCGHIFCKRCLSKIVSMECPLCRKFFSFNSLQRLYVEQPEDPDRMKKYNLMRKLVLTCDSKEEDIVTMRKEVDVWQGSKTVREEKHCPVRKTVEILDRLQRVKDQKRRHKREIKHLKRSAMRKEQELLELIIQYQQEAGRLRAELKLRQKTDDLHVSAAKKKLTRPLPIPPRVTATCPTVQIIRPSPDQHVSVANTGSDLRRRTSLNKGKRNGRMNVNPSSLEVPPSAPPPSPPQVRSTTAVRHYVPSDNSVVIDVDHSRDTGARSPYDTPGARAPHVAGRGIGLSDQRRGREQSRDIHTVLTCPLATRSPLSIRQRYTGKRPGIMGPSMMIDR